MPKGEVVTSAIIHDALRKGKQIFVPYIYNDRLHDHPKPRSVLDMVSLTSKSDYETLKPDAWGIPTVAENSLAKRHRILEWSGAVSQGVASSRRSERSERGDSNEFRKLDLIVMPGVAFDGELGRLGHGKGFYDFFLKRYHDSTTSLPGEEIRMPFLGACHGFYSSKPVFLSLTHELFSWT